MTSNVNFDRTCCHILNIFLWVKWRVCHKYESNLATTRNNFWQLTCLHPSVTQFGGKLSICNFVSPVDSATCSLSFWNYGNHECQLWWNLFCHILNISYGLKWTGCSLSIHQQSLAGTEASHSERNVHLASAIIMLTLHGERHIYAFSLRQYSPILHYYYYYNYPTVGTWILWYWWGVLFIQLSVFLNIEHKPFCKQLTISLNTVES